MLRFSMTVPIEAFSVCITGVSATTDTTSVNAPMAIVNGKRFELPTCTLMPVCWAVEKPSSSTFSE